MNLFDNYRIYIYILQYITNMSDINVIKRILIIILKTQKFFNSSSKKVEVED
jgi:hypothetical protein